jgi:hypothetical protein
MKKIISPIIIICILFSCRNKNTQQQQSGNIEQKIDSFFPVTSFLKGQLHEIDSLPVTPLHVITIKDKTDSVWLKRDSLHVVLQPFFYNEINETNLSKYFTETKFNDQSINRITFTYAATNIKLPDSIQLRQWDVYVEPETGKVTKVYIVREFIEDKKHVLQQLTWNTGKGAKIVTISGNSNHPTIKEESFVWKF